MLIDSVRWMRVIRRVLTPAGNTVNLSITATATTASWTFPRAEVDMNYGVSFSANWLTTGAVTSKSTTGLTLSFGTAAPANATVDIMTFRSE